MKLETFGSRIRNRVRELRVLSDASDATLLRALSRDQVPGDSDGNTERRVR